ncbi:hypothetical protein WBG78_14385 [Chryseolinea sp. T2]|uniref:hypothetical protein n=1 Tax=Chryseolinea sp. T2 TaxID=3129255 RepID=UPI003076FAC1
MSDVSAYPYLTFDDIRLAVDKHGVYNLKNPERTGSNFYKGVRGEQSYYEFIDNLWIKGIPSPFHTAIGSYLSDFDKDRLPKITTIWEEHFNAYHKGQLQNLQDLRLTKLPSVAIYPSLSIKEVDEPVSHRSVLNLAEEAQSKYVEQMLAKDSKLLSDPTISRKLFMDVDVKNQDDLYSSDHKDKKSTEYQTVSIILSTQNLCSDPADRIVKATYRIYSKDLEYKAWANAKLEWSSVDLGSEEDAITSGFSVAGGIGKDTTLGVAASYKRGRSKLEKFNFSKRYVVFSGSIDKNSILIYQEGVPGIDLSGSLKFEAQIKKDGIGAKENKLLILSAKYTIRHVLDERRFGGVEGRTYIEGDDNVEYITFTLVKPYLYSQFNTAD